jgi:uroporphyrin-III C-methyltransferase
MHYICIFMKIPHVTLIGAGPGDPELITLKGVNALRKADVILYDALSNDELLEYAPANTLKIFVGKRLGCHSISQADINRQIVELANKHGHVVRLKGGDPFVFGRATEEIEAVTAAGISVSVIPGISSAIAIPETQFIPLTARGINESFWVTTGTTKSGSISADLHFAAQSSSTVVVLMAMSKLKEIMDIFSMYGKGKTPVAIIQNGTKPEEKVVTGVVENIFDKAQKSGMANPAVIIIGEVVNLRMKTIFP